MKALLRRFLRFWFPPSPWHQCHAPSARERLASYQRRRARAIAEAIIENGNAAASDTMRLGEFSRFTRTENPTPFSVLSVGGRPQHYAPPTFSFPWSKSDAQH